MTLRGCSQPVPSVSGAVGARCPSLRVFSRMSRWLVILVYLWMSTTFCPEVPRNLHREGGRGGQRNVITTSKTDSES